MSNLKMFFALMIVFGFISMMSLSIASFSCAGELQNMDKNTDVFQLLSIYFADPCSGNMGWFVILFLLPFGVIAFLLALEHIPFFGRGG